MPCESSLTVMTPIGSEALVCVAFAPVTARQ
ncbi:hypothetical protein ACVILK_006611 [Bradyrhizobium embrapense]